MAIPQTTFAPQIGQHRAAQWIAEQYQVNCPHPRGVGDEGLSLRGALAKAADKLGAVLWNLFDIDAKFGDEETTERCLQYLDQIGAKELKAKTA